MPRDHQENAVKTDPTYALAWLWLGISTARAGQSERAREAARRCLELAPECEAGKDLLSASRSA